MLKVRRVLNQIKWEGLCGGGAKSDVNGRRELRQIKI